MARETDIVFLALAIYAMHKCCQILLLSKATIYSGYSKIHQVEIHQVEIHQVEIHQVDFSDVTLVGEDGKEKSPPQLQILTLSQN